MPKPALWALALLLVACGDDDDVPPGGADAALHDGAGGDGAVPGADAGPDAAMPNGVGCGEMMCSGADICCRSEVGPTIVPTCQDPLATCNGAQFGCDGPEDCPGQECCGGIGGASCVQPGSCGIMQSLACHGDPDCEGGVCCMGIPYPAPYGFCSTGPCPE